MLGTFTHDLNLRLANDVANLENKMGFGLIGGAFAMVLAPFVAVGMLTSSVATYAAAKKMKKRLYKNAMKHDTLSPYVVFTYLSMTTYIEDSKTRCVYAPDWFRDNREAFDDAYMLMRDTEQNYVEHALLKQLGAGILPENDEIELTRYFHMLKECGF